MIGNIYIYKSSETNRFAIKLGTRSILKNKLALVFIFLSFFLPLRLNTRGGRQTGIPVYQVLKVVS